MATQQAGQGQVLTEVLAPDVRPWRWTTGEFQQLGEEGRFAGRRVMLIEGEILEREMTSNPDHFTAVELAQAELRASFGVGFVVRAQGPFDIGRSTDPEPDLAVVRGGPRDFAQAHPTQAVLIVEVSSATLRYDQNEKSSLYASVAVPEYAILNIRARQIEVRREPVQDAAQRFGWRYSSLQVLAPEERWAPLHAINSVLVRDLLP